MSEIEQDRWGSVGDAAKAVDAPNVAALTPMELAPADVLESLHKLVAENRELRKRLADCQGERDAFLMSVHQAIHG